MIDFNCNAMFFILNCFVSLVKEPACCSPPKKRKRKKHFCNTQDTNAVLLLGESGNEAQWMHQAEK